MKELYIDVCDLKDEIEELVIGDMVYLSGEIYTARDAAHKRMSEALDSGKELPFDIKGQIIYYMGPSPARPGNVIGSAGPTTASRMDKYTPRLLDMGLLGMIGKGKRTDEVKEAVVRNKAIYLAAIGGVGALLSKCISYSEVIAYEDLGTEAIRRLIIKKFPAIVVLDIFGGDLYNKANNIDNIDVFSL
ncbi:MAG: Fe-S-containing hydro-lyase [Lachnospiraceae bacterium]|nr:Fe-S-containing hydro-lyase [Lachnospiraceae bacterium]